MSRMTYAAALAWIDANDETAEHDPTVLADLVSVVMVADLSGTNPMDVATTIARRRVERHLDAQSRIMAEAARTQLDVASAGGRVVVWVGPLTGTNGQFPYRVHIEGEEKPRHYRTASFAARAAVNAAVNTQWVK